jgi:hypothetical protein
MPAFALAWDEAVPARAHGGNALNVRARRLLGDPWHAASPRRGTRWRGAAEYASAPAAAIFADDARSAAPAILVGDPYAEGGRGAATVRDVASGDVIRVLRGGEAGAFGRSVAVLGDVDGDGETEAAIGAAGAVRIVGLRDGRLRYELVEDPASDFGASAAACGDWDRDGVTDFAVGAPGAGVVACFSGRTGTRLRHFARGAGFGRVLAGGGDADGDGVGDLLIGAPDQPPTASRWGRMDAEAISGATGATLWTDGTSMPETCYGAAAAFVGDLDGDGRDEWCLGAPRNRYPAGADAGSATIYFGPDGAVRRGLESDPRRFVAFGIAAGRATPGADGSARFFIGALDPRPQTAGFVVEVFRARDFAFEERRSVRGRLSASRANVAVGAPTGPSAAVIWGVFYEDSVARCAALAP